MAFTLVSSGGNVVEPTMLNIACSGTVHPYSCVEFSATGGAGVNIASASSTTTNIFGICMDYKEGKSDAEVRVIPFNEGQLWQADCVAAVTTAQVGLAHQLNAGALLVRNTATDMGAGNAHTAVFRAVAITGSTSGSGKLIGYFRTQEAPVPSDMTTFYM